MKILCVLPCKSIEDDGGLPTLKRAGTDRIEKAFFPSEVKFGLLCAFGLEEHELEGIRTGTIAIVGEDREYSRVPFPIPSLVDRRVYILRVPITFQALRPEIIRIDVSIEGDLVSWPIALAQRPD
ncbi:MAG TPA: hypothetical protein VG457_18795 [Planctomycetota bacterium]|nr:hypothetical protein [Planctomycetota bacterium]